MVDGNYRNKCLGTTDIILFNGKVFRWLSISSLIRKGPGNTWPT